MKIVVLKFGGSSVGSISKIKKVAKIISLYSKKKYKVIVVSSAMGGVTNNLIKKTKEISKNFNSAEYDVLLSSGEQMSCALISGCLENLGFKSRSWLSWQVPIFTEGNFKNSRIVNIFKSRLIKYINSGGIPILTGFQGINYENRLTTLGRGGSDATAIMIAKFFNAEKCIIFTDVEGVYTTDPNLIKNAKKIDKISYEEMLEMASLGAKVMQPASIQDARLNRINIDVKSSFKKKTGTLITQRKNINKSKIITGISFTKNDSKITLIGVVDKPGIAASIFEPLYKSSINVDMVVQNISSDGKETDLTFTVKTEDVFKCEKLIKKNKNISFRSIVIKKNVSKVSIIGVGMITTPGVTYRMFRALAKNNINIQVISTSEIKISVLINKIHTKKAVSSLHNEFGLGK
tara:strand:+ start:2057 stop:3271 length:1215 start_codon:yes stop_codon:yes gene_type:complete